MRRHPCWEGWWCTRLSSAAAFCRPSTVLDELDVIAVGGERTEECGTVGPGEIFESSSVTDLGVGGVADLDLWVCGRASLSKSTVCSRLTEARLRGFAVVGFDGVADDGVRHPGRHVEKGVVQFGEERVGDGDARLLHVRGGGGRKVVAV